MSAQLLIFVEDNVGLIFRNLQSPDGGVNQTLTNTCNPARGWIKTGRLHKRLCKVSSFEL